MKFEKINTYDLEKCYAINQIDIDGKPYIVVASEVVNACLLFDMEGNFVEKIWDSPGGTMSITAIPNASGMFLATQKFYGPDDSKESKIVLAVRNAKGKWDIRDVIQLPQLHRFDIITRGKNRYLIACTIKTSSEYQEDWRSAGRVYVAKLPEDISSLGQGDQLKLTVIKDGLFKNHGYSKLTEHGYEYALVSADQGIFKMIPPETSKENWTIECILEEAISDAVLVDLDGDGEDEIVAIAPFHGDVVQVYKKEQSKYKKIWETTVEFAHAIWEADIYGKKAVILGHRMGKRSVFILTMEPEVTKTQVDENVGSANVMGYQHDGELYFVSTNREIDEVAFYKVVKE